MKNVSSTRGLYHVNPEVGYPQKCRAHFRKCPYVQFGHWEKESEARKSYEHAMRRTQINTMMRKAKNGLESMSPEEVFELFSNGQPSEGEARLFLYDPYRYLSDGSEPDEFYASKAYGYIFSRYPDNGLTLDQIRDLSAIAANVADENKVGVFNLGYDYIENPGRAAMIAIANNPYISSKELGTFPMKTSEMLVMNAQNEEELVSIYMNRETYNPDFERLVLASPYADVELYDYVAKNTTFDATALCMYYGHDLSDSKSDQHENDYESPTMEERIECYTYGGNVPYHDTIHINENWFHEEQFKTTFHQIIDAGLVRAPSDNAKKALEERFTVIQDIHYLQDLKDRKEMDPLYYPEVFQDREYARRTGNENNQYADYRQRFDKEKLKELGVNSRRFRVYCFFFEPESPRVLADEKKTEFEYYFDHRGIKPYNAVVEDKVELYREPGEDFEVAKERILKEKGLRRITPPYINNDPSTMRLDFSSISAKEPWQRLTVYDPSTGETRAMTSGERAIMRKNQTEDKINERLRNESNEV